MVWGLEKTYLGLGGEEEHVQEGTPVESGKDVVHLVVDVPKQRRHSEGEHHVAEPVGGGGQRDGHGADLAGVDLGRVGPRRGAPAGGEGGDEEVGAGDHGPRRGRVLVDDPGDVLVGLGDRVADVGLATVLLDGARDEEPRHHAEGAEHERRAAAPAVEEYDGGQGEGHVDDVLD